MTANQDMVVLIEKRSHSSSFARSTVNDEHATFDHANSLHSWTPWYRRAG
jgi:hypothetical protein